ncbi:MAG: hypothetical protein HY050_00075 [Actinobacteria bacterium]|nr:hypothetical protein [Actinomycetota bacterium]
MSSKRKVITVAVTTVALSLGTIGFASATSAKSSVKVKSSIANSIANQTGVHMGGFGYGEQGNQLASVLAGLVTKGTLTQAQVDAINAAITAARAANQNQGVAERTARLQLVATTIGIDVATLQTRLSAGDSLATIAGAKTAALIAALVAEETKEIDAAVTAGKITAAQATTLKTNLTAQVTAMVNGTGGMHGGFGEGMGQGFGEGMGQGFGEGMDSGTQVLN